jgi:plastocyanin
MIRLLIFLMLVLSACSANDFSQPTQTHVVEIRGMKYYPEILHIRPGDQVTFVNHDFVTHTATAAMAPGSIAWSTRDLEQAESQTLSFDTEMVAAYYCKLHPNMTASVFVD